jgi:hypothetical protein
VANKITAGVVVATIAFWAYTRTLLPGVDLGETGYLQAAVLSPEVGARRAYPLYFTLARPFVAFTAPDNPARALNLVSAIWAAAAVGLLVALCASIARSLVAGAVAGLLLAFSYTFWTEAVMADVYSLHLALIALCLLLLYGYARRPTAARLLVFAAVYAVSFGNHLGMILLLVPFAIFVLHVTPDRRVLVRPRVIGAVLLLGIAAALQYTPTVWFDTTAQVRRESTVLGVQASELRDRLAMWSIDAQRQFGAVGLALAATGVVRLWLIARPWAWLALTSYALNAIVALTTHVGDGHVFLLPGHFFVALCAGSGVAVLVQRAGRDGTSRRGPRPRFVIVQTVAAILALGYAGWRGWTTWPLADRHQERRGEQVVAQLTAGITDRDALLVSQMDWRLENVLLYTGRYLRSDLAWVRLADVIGRWPFLLDDTHRTGRDVVMTADAAAAVLAAHGPSPVTQDVTAAVSLGDAVARIPRGLPYVLSIVTPPPGYSLGPGALDRLVGALTDDRVPARTPASYEIIAGLAGEAPQIHRSSSRPFTMRFQLFDEPFTAHVDGWVPFETFRRAGFGHLLRGRERLLTIERGVSLVSLGRDGRALPPVYAAGLFAPQPRFRIAAATLQLAAQPGANGSNVPLLAASRLARTLNKSPARP